MLLDRLELEFPQQLSFPVATKTASQQAHCGWLQAPG